MCSANYGGRSKSKMPGPISPPSPGLLQPERCPLVARSPRLSTPSFIDKLFHLPSSPSCAAFRPLAQVFIFKWPSGARYCEFVFGNFSSKSICMPSTISELQHNQNKIDFNLLFRFVIFLEVMLGQKMAIY